MGTATARIWQSLRRVNPRLLLALVEDVVDARQRRRLRIGWDYPRESFYRAALDTDAPEDDFDADPRAERFVLGLNAPDAGFLRVRDLTLDGDKVIYALIGGFGESGDRYHTDTLAGIDRLRELRALSFGGLTRDASLEPLAKLPKLRKLSLSAADGFRNYTALLKIATLRELSIVNLFDRDRWYREAVETIVALAKRGVRVTGVEWEARALIEKQRFGDALALYDHLIHYEYVDPGTLLDALYAVLPSNNHLPIDRRRIARYVAAATPHGKKLPGIFYNAACCALESGDVAGALKDLRLARTHGYAKPKQIAKDPVFAPIRDDPRFRTIFADIK